jgi:hypothetical protein
MLYISFVAKKDTSVTFEKLAADRWIALVD